jgi:phospholipid/cholesterol/gamma-HCH transport system substrate-binding protein
VTVEYKRVFDSTGPLIRSIPPEDARTLTGELGTGLEGRGTTLRDLMGDSHQLARTLAAEAAVLDSLSVQLTALTGTLAASGPELGSGVNDLASFTASLRASRKDLDGLLRDGPRFLDEVNGLLKDSRPAMRCTLYALGAQSPPLFTDTTTRELRHALTVIASGIPGFAESITHERPEGTYIRIKPVITLPGVAPDSAHYQQEVPEPILPPLYECVGDKQEAPVRPNPEPTPEATRVGTSQGPFITTDPRGADAPTTSPWSRRLPMLPVLVASLVLAYAAFRLGTTIRRYRRIR